MFSGVCSKIFQFIYIKQQPDGMTLLWRLTGFLSLDTPHVMSGHTPGHGQGERELLRTIKIFWAERRETTGERLATTSPHTVRPAWEAAYRNSAWQLTSFGKLQAVELVQIFKYSSNQLSLFLGKALPRHILPVIWSCLENQNVWLSFQWNLKLTWKQIFL